MYCRIYSQVHLTWINEELAEWPKTLMFSSFDKWVRDLMITNIIRDELKNERMHSKYDRVDYYRSDSWLGRDNQQSVFCSEKNGTHAAFTG